MQENSGLDWGRLFSRFLDGKSFKFMKGAKVEGVYNFRDKLEAVWWELIGLALQCNNHGALWNDEVSCGHVDEIAVLTDRTETEIQICVEWYCKPVIGMAEMTKYGLKIVNFDRYQLVDKIEKIKEQNRIRQQRYRDMKKLIAPPPLREHNVTVTHSSRDSSQENKEIEQEQESEPKQEALTPEVVKSDECDRDDKPSWADDLCPITKDLIKRKFLDYGDIDLFAINFYIQDKIEERKSNLPLLYAVIHYVVARYNPKTVQKKGEWFMSSVTHNLACFDFAKKTGWDEAVEKYNPKTPDDWEKVLEETLPKMVKAYADEHKE